MKKEVRAKIERRLRYSTVVEVKSNGGIRHLSDEEKSVKSLRRMKSRSNWEIKFFRIPANDIQQELDVRAETEDKFFGSYKEKTIDIEPIRTIDEWLDLLPEGWKVEAKEGEDTLGVPWDKKVYTLSCAVLYCCLWSEARSGSFKWEELSQAVMRSAELPENIYRHTIKIIGSKGWLIVDRKSGRILGREGYEWCDGVDVDEYQRFYGVLPVAGKEYDVLDFVLEAETPEGYQFPEQWWREEVIALRFPAIVELPELPDDDPLKHIFVEGTRLPHPRTGEVPKERVDELRAIGLACELTVWTGGYLTEIHDEEEVQAFCSWLEGGVK